MLHHPTAAHALVDMPGGTLYHSPPRAQGYSEPNNGRIGAITGIGSLRGRHVGGEADHLIGTRCSGLS
jgi:hypothetical protein